MANEMRERLHFVAERDGASAAVDWAEKALAAYVHAAATKGRYSEQIEDLTQYLKDCGRKVEWVQVSPKQVNTPELHSVERWPGEEARAGNEEVKDGD